MMSVEYVRDAKGRVIKETFTNHKGEVNIVHRDRDENGYIIKATHIDHLGNVEEWEYERNAQNNVVGIKHSRS